MQRKARGKETKKAKRDKLVENRKYKVRLYDGREKILVWYRYRGRLYFVDFDNYVRYSFNQVTAIEEKEND